MGSILVCIGCYCCLFTLRPLSIEIIALIANLCEIGFLIWGIVDIPWDYINTGGEVCFYITCGFIVLTFLLLLILMCFRCSGTINTTKNGVGMCLCITDLIFDILAFILIIVSESIILYKMWDADDDYYWDNGRRYHRHYDSIFSDSEWAAAVISTSVAELAILIHCYCVSFLMKLIHLKTDLSYKEYTKALEQNSNTLSSDNPIGRAINVFQNPPNYYNNNLTFLGYDKDGHPIYSGNNTYQVINTPVVPVAPVVPVTTNQNINNNNNIIVNKNNNNINNKKGDGK